MAGAFPFAADQFEVSTVLIPVGGTDRKAPISVPMKADKVVGAGKPVTFYGEWVPDESPTRRNESLLGRYEAEVTIRGTKGPLAGAERHLIRAIIEVKDYPGLKLKETTLRLSNKGDAFKTQVQVEIPGIRLSRTKPERVVARLGATLAGTWKQAGSASTLSAAKAKLSAPAVDLAGGKGVVEVALPPAALSPLTRGEYKGSTVTLRAPWDKQETIDLTLEKSAWLLGGPSGPLVFDFSRRQDKELTCELAAKFQTLAEVEEEVWLCTRAEADKPTEENEIKFKGASGQTVTLQAKGLGRAVAIGRNGPLKKTEKLSLTLLRGEDLPLGECTATLYLIGPAVKPLEVLLRVRRQRFTLQAPVEIVFDLSSKKGDKATRKVPVSLDTDLNTDEEVWLSDTPVADASVRVRDLSFLPREKGGKVRKLSVVGLGNRALVKSLTTSETSKLAITLARPREKLPSGWYESKLYLVGTGVESRELKVKVKVDQPIVYLLGDDGEDVRRLDELSLLGLAGRTFRCALKVRTELEENSSPDVYDTLAKELGASAEARLRLSALDDLPLVFRSSRDRLWVELSIPASVREGSYQARLGLNLSADKNRPLLLELPVRVQVAHFAVRPHETGTLKLQVTPPAAPNPPKEVQPPKTGTLKLQGGQDSGMRVKKTISLTTQARRDQVVRWSVKRVPLARKGLLQPLEEKRLTVQYKDRSVIEEKDQPAGPNTPLAPGEKCDLTVAVDCAGLAPGWYHAGLHFQSSANDQPLKVEGFSEDLTVEVLVPGRDLRAMQVEGSKAQVDAATPVRVEVTSHGCDLGWGGITLVDDKGKAVGPVQPIEAQHKITEEADPQDSSLHRAKFVIQVMPRRAGANTYLVTWPRCFPSNEQEGTQRPAAAGVSRGELAQLVTVVADGRIEVKPEVGFVGEQVKVFVTAAPAASKGMGVLTLQAAHPDQKDPASVELRDPQGSGQFTGAFPLSTPGVYTLSLPGARGWRLRRPRLKRGSCWSAKSGRPRCATAAAG